MTIIIENTRFVDEAKQTWDFIMQMESKLKIFIKCSLFTEYSGPSVTRFFLTTEFKPKSDLTPINAPAQRTLLMLSCTQTC